MEKYKREFIKIFWVFIIGSLIGFLVETMVGIVVDGRLECRQGLIYEKRDIRSLMEMNIQSEQEAITNYLKAKRYTRNQSVRNLLDRIILH